VLYVSSLMAAGPSHPEVARREHHRTTSFTKYGDSKLGGERIAWEVARSMSLEVVIARPPLVYGPRDQDVLLMIKSANARLVAQPGLRPTPLSVIHCHDLVRGLILAAEKGRPLPASGGEHVLAGGGAPIDHVPDDPSPPAGEGIYYFTDGGRYTVASFGQTAAAVLGKRAFTVRLPRSAVWTLGVVNEAMGRVRGVPPALTLDKAKGSLAPGWWCDDARARAEIGYVAEMPLQKGLEQTIRWLRDHGELR
jgi:nucleoside-diphosphate-sugar epimerase